MGIGELFLKKEAFLRQDGKDFQGNKGYSHFLKVMIRNIKEVFQVKKLMGKVYLAKVLNNFPSIEKLHQLFQGYSQNWLKLLSSTRYIFVNRKAFQGRGCFFLWGEGDKF